MSDDVRDRALDALARAIPYGYGINKGITDKALAALDAAGIALVDAAELRALREFWQWSEVMEIVAMSPAETLRAVLCPARAAVADSEPETAG